MYFDYSIQLNRYTCSYKYPGPEVMEGTFEEVCTLTTVFNLIDTHVPTSIQALRLWRGQLKRYVL